MLARLRSALTYANAMSTVAVFLALGGVTYAASALPAGSVGTSQLANGAVTPAKLSAQAAAAGSGAGALAARINAVGAGKTAFGPVSGDATAAVAPALVAEDSPATAITAADLDVLAWDPTSGLIANKVVVTLYVARGSANATATALRCTTSNLGSCTDRGHSVVIAPGSSLSFRVVDPAFNGFPIDAQIGWRAAG